MRPSWPEYFMGLARLAATRSTCPVLQVGSVFVDPDTHIVLATGFNGSPRGLPHCGQACAERKQGERSDECKAVHSEANAIYSAALQGTRLNGSHVFITAAPCVNCARAMIQVGVRSIMYDMGFLYPQAISELHAANIALAMPPEKVNA